MRRADEALSAHPFHFHGRSVCPLGYDTAEVKTADGFSLTLFRSQATRPSTEPPVLLVPGLGSNRFTFGLHRQAGLPHVLETFGRDVWLAELRGSRSARFVGPGKAQLGLCKKLEDDLPALVAHIAEATGHAELDLVGHSLGGLIALLYAGGPGQACVRRVVTIATPGTLEGLGGLFEKTPLFPMLGRGLEKFVGQMERFSVAPLAKLSGPVPHLAAMSRHFLPGAVDAATRRRYLDHAVEDVPGTELAQLVRWAVTGALTALDGRPLGADLARVTCPVLSVLSSRDKVVPASSARAAFERVGSADKRLLQVSRSDGSRRDYAHADILLAPTAQDDVLEPIAAFLSQPRSRGAGARLGNP